MPVNQTKLHLLAYDIADPKRLAKVHRAVRRVGIPLQYSVFLVPGTRGMLDALLADLRGIISQSEDDIRAYTLPARIKVGRLGRQQLADGIMLIGDRPVDRAINALIGAAANA